MYYPYDTDYYSSVKKNLILRKIHEFQKYCAREQPGSNKFILCVFIFMKYWKRTHCFYSVECRKVPGVKDVERMRIGTREFVGVAGRYLVLVTTWTYTFIPIQRSVHSEWSHCILCKLSFSKVELK